MVVTTMPQNSDSGCTCLGFFGSYDINRIAPICCHIILSKITVAIIDILKGTIMATNKLADGCHKNALNSDSGCTCLGFLGCYNTNRIVCICVASHKEVKSNYSYCQCFGCFADDHLPFLWPFLWPFCMSFLRSFLLQRSLSRNLQVLHNFGYKMSVRSV
jgi:hypothetical protein